MVPHIAEELWEKLDKSKMICNQAWPEVDDNLFARRIMLIYLFR